MRKSGIDLELKEAISILNAARKNNNIMFLKGAIRYIKAMAPKQSN